MEIALIIDSVVVDNKMICLKEPILYKLDPNDSSHIKIMNALDKIMPKYTFNTDKVVYTVEI
jgi:hypothetical protein